MTALSFDGQQVNIVVSAFVPLVVPVVLRRITDPRVKHALLAFLAALTGAATTAAQRGGRVGVVDLLVGIGTAYFTAQAAYSVIWRPSTVSGIIQDVTDRAGIGVVLKVAPMLVRPGATAGSGAATASPPTSDAGGP